MPPTTGDPGGAGEFGVAAAMAAVACAYARATGTMPTAFPINHDEPLGFDPLPTVPPIPAVAHRRPRPRLLGAPVSTHTFILNGERVSVDVAGRRAAAVGAARRPRRHRPEVRLRARTSARRAPATSTARRSTRARSRSRTSSRPTRSPRSRACPPPSAADLHPMQEAWLEHGRRPVRLLPARPDHGRGRQGPAGQGRGPGDHRRRPRRDPQHLPLRHLPPDPRGDRRRRQEHVRAHTCRCFRITGAFPRCPFSGPLHTAHAEVAQQPDGISVPRRAALLKQGYVRREPPAAQHPGNQDPVGCEGSVTLR